MEWTKLSDFWRFQIAGWSAFIIASFPLKLDLMESVPGALLLCITRDGSSFLLTFGMRSVYREFWSNNGAAMAVLIIFTCTIGGLLQAGFFFLIREVIPNEAEIHFRRSMAFTALYERTGLLFGWSFLYFGIRLLISGKEREAQLARLESEHKATELRLLRSIMNPHFLFNALNFIKSELLGKYDSLAQVVQAFTNYLQYSLITRNENFVEIGNEFDAIEGYLAVEKARFGEEIEVECLIDIEARSVLVPGIIIQPLVENAIKHGRRQLNNVPLKIALYVQRTEKELRLEVSNSGEWQVPSQFDDLSRIGLKNLKERLQLLYGDRHLFEILAETNRVLVRVRLPILD